MKNQPDLTPLAPTVVPDTSPELLEELELQNDLELPEIDGESVVEAAELLLREGAPHDFDVIVVGAGPGGLACATHLSQHGQKVALIERDEIGGVCLNRGCIPTKTLLESVGVLRFIRRANWFGVSVSGDITPDLRQMQERKRKVIAALRVQAQELARESGVQMLRGTARLKGEGAVELSDGTQKRRFSAVHVVLATGAVPTKLPVPGADLPGVLTSDEILELEEPPRRLIVLGAGAVGVEFASIFAELGTRVFILEKGGAVLPGEDEDIQAQMQKNLEQSNIRIELNASVERIEQRNEALRVVWKTALQEYSLEAEIVLMATERRANIADLGLEQAGIETRSGVVKVEEDGSTGATGVWAIGDCVRGFGWAHQAALEGRQVADAILGIEPNDQTCFVPRCYYTFPEVASVGMTLQEAQGAGIEARLGRFDFGSNERANLSGEQSGFVKLVVENRTGKLLGAHIIGPRATELINEIALALRDGDTVERLTDSLHAHPTFAEVLPGAARAALR